MSYTGIRRFPFLASPEGPGNRGGEEGLLAAPLAAGEAEASLRFVARWVILTGDFQRKAFFSQDSGLL